MIVLRWLDLPDADLLTACLPPCAAPHIPIVSEENRQVPYETRKVAVCWRGCLYVVLGHEREVMLLGAAANRGVLRTLVHASHC